MEPKPKKVDEPYEYTDEQINEIAEWLEDLTLSQIFFIKRCYEETILSRMQAGNNYVH